MLCGLLSFCAYCVFYFFFFFFNDTATTEIYTLSLHDALPILPRMPNGGSVNQTVSSDLTTMSFGELSGLPSNLSISTVMVPSNSVRVTRRASCSQVTRRPWRSRVLPFELFEGSRKTLTRPVSSCQRIMRLLGMSLHTR